LSLVIEDSRLVRQQRRVVLHPHAPQRVLDVSDGRVLLLRSARVDAVHRRVGAGVKEIRAQVVENVEAVGQHGAVRQQPCDLAQRGTKGTTAKVIDQKVWHLSEARDEHVQQHLRGRLPVQHGEG